MKKNRNSQKISKILHYVYANNRAFHDNKVLYFRKINYFFTNLLNSSYNENSVYIKGLGRVNRVLLLKSWQEYIRTIIIGFKKVNFLKKPSFIEGKQYNVSILLQHIDRMFEYYREYNTPHPQWRETLSYLGSILSKNVVKKVYKKPLPKLPLERGAKRSTKKSRPLPSEKIEEAGMFDLEESNAKVSMGMDTDMDYEEEMMPEEAMFDERDLDTTVEERRVNAQILHNGKRRNTFVKGTKCVIRCWIGLPDLEFAASSNEAIPTVAIPDEGLLLSATLFFNGKSESLNLILPAKRTARSGDCDFTVEIPEDIYIVSADIVFSYKGSVFEAVRVQALALDKDEEDSSSFKLEVRAQIERREVSKLKERIENDAIFLWGQETTEQEDTDPALREFGKSGGKQYNLSDTNSAIEWLNSELFSADKSLVRQQARQAETPEEPLLDYEHPEVLKIFRNFARHGAVLYNQLTQQHFKDPGERIQLLNYTPKEYVPLEYVYDRGFPTESAKLCEGWLEALMSDAKECPVCKYKPVLESERDNVDTICPLGFWSLQKIIERIDPAITEESKNGFSCPSTQRPALHAIDSVLFAGSDNVSAQDLEKTWDTLEENFEHSIWAKSWTQWKETLQEEQASLLLMIPHHGVKSHLDYLEIGDEDLPASQRELSRGQFSKFYTNPKSVKPGPIVVLLGCKTVAQTETGYVNIARRFQQLETSIVVGTLANILGRHAAPVAQELVKQLASVDDESADFGTIMRRVRRRMLAKGYLMALCLVALGDAQWKLAPKESSKRVTTVGDDDV